ncbi:MAG TPA: hypothetical protein VNM66_03110 [Thermodesulfobacteriota bacterium]|nr:hypothetical protein [Thermodesulfobacteriota bacterium]
MDLAVALDTDDLDDQALLRAAMDRGAFAAWGLEVSLAILDADEAVAATLDGRADVAITARGPVIQALAAGAPLAVLGLVGAWAIVMHERTFFERTPAIYAFMAVIGPGYGRLLFEGV